MAFSPGKKKSDFPSTFATSSKLLATSAYASPELIKWTMNDHRGQPPDPFQCDIWNFAATLFEMATGSALVLHYYDKATPDSIEKLLNWNGLRESQNKMLNDIHPESTLIAFADLLHWMLAADVRARPTTMDDILLHAFFKPGRGSMREHFVVNQIENHLTMRNSASPRPLAKVMISYCWADTSFVLNKLALKLAPLVRGMWLDRLGGESGMGEWTRKSMKKGIEISDLVIAVVSESYLKSKNCGYEMEVAAKLNKTIIPIKFGVPFSRWPPAKVGDTITSTQFFDSDTNDSKLFIDFGDLDMFETKFHHELLPRLQIEKENFGFDDENQFKDLRLSSDFIGFGDTAADDTVAVDENFCQDDMMV